MSNLPKGDKFGQCRWCEFRAWGKTYEDVDKALGDHVIKHHLEKFIAWNESEREWLNTDCIECPMRYGCLALCAENPHDVMEPPCGKFAIGLTDDINAFWTRPVGNWVLDPGNAAPDDLRFVPIADKHRQKVAVIE